MIKSMAVITCAAGIIAITGIVFGLRGIREENSGKKIAGLILNGFIACPFVFGLVNFLIWQTFAQVLQRSVLWFPYLSYLDSHPFPIYDVIFVPDTYQHLAMDLRKITKFFSLMNPLILSVLKCFIYQASIFEILRSSRFLRKQKSVFITVCRKQPIAFDFYQKRGYEAFYIQTFMLEYKDSDLRQLGV